MDLTLNEEQTAVRDAIRGVLRERQPSERVRAVMAGDAGVDVDLWRAAAELGWFGLALPEAAGGAGYGVPEAMLLFTELGRALTPGPWLGTVLAVQALADATSHRLLLESLLAGKKRVAVVDDASDRLGAGPRLEGKAELVLDTVAADALLVLGTSAVRLVPTNAAGVGVATSHGIDPTRRPATVTFEGETADVLSNDANALRQVATVLVAAESAGVAERAVEMSVEYAKVREQFGKPIGTFQAIKHRCADMAVRAEVARSHVTYAAVALQDGEPDAPFHVHVAKTLAANAALQNTTDNIQNPGGMGYTWESDAHLYLKRARALEHCFGTRTAHLDALVASWRTAS